MTAPDCGYECPFTEEAHLNGYASHDFEAAAPSAATELGLTRETLAEAMCRDAGPGIPADAHVHVCDEHRRQAGRILEET